MLSPEEFNVGTFKAARPGSLVLPRTKYETLALICEGDDAPVAVLLAGDHAFRSFPTEDAENWMGLVVPNVHIEVDESSLFDPDSNGYALGVLIREETKLVIRSKAERSYSRSVPLVIKSGLPEGRGSAGFARWQVVVGQGEEKRILHRVDIEGVPKE
jgi:hypothetical protein